MHVHVLQHVPFEGLGSIETWLSHRGDRVTFTRFFESTHLPELADIDFVIALGGPMSVNDEEQLPWLREEKRFIVNAIASNKAVLGICLGSQLIASALGRGFIRQRKKRLVGSLYSPSRPCPALSPFRQAPRSSTGTERRSTSRQARSILRGVPSVEIRPSRLGRGLSAYSSILKRRPKALKRLSATVPTSWFRSVISSRNRCYGECPWPTMQESMC